MELCHVRFTSLNHVRCLILFRSHCIGLYHNVTALAWLCITCVSPVWHALHHTVSPVFYLYDMHCTTLYHLCFTCMACLASHYHLCFACNTCITSHCVTCVSPVRHALYHTITCVSPVWHALHHTITCVSPVRHALQYTVSHVFRLYDMHCITLSPVFHL